MEYTFLFIGLYCLLNISTISTQLTGKEHTCDDENGKAVHVDFITDPCIHCYCRDGIVKCEKEKCKSLSGCHMIPFQIGSRETCCAKCMGCEENGKHYDDGESWPSLLSPCTVNQCKAGVITTSDPVCPPLTCENPVQLPGQCCKSCATCDFEDTKHSEGELFTPYQDKCINCQCMDGHTTCQKNRCPVLNCPENKIIYDEDSCCPRCQGQREIFTVPGMCLFRYKMYKSAQSVQVDDCTQCTCFEGTMKCETLTCPIVDCPIERLVHNGTACCPMCKQREKSCDFSGQLFQHGDAFTRNCQECRCNDGDISCRLPECPAEQNCPLNTHELIYKKEDCCPVCKERGGLCTVFGDPHYVTFDKNIYDFQGTCRYLLTKDCSPNSQFAVYTQNFDRYNMPGAWTKSVTIMLDDDKISLQKSGKVRVNKHKISLPYAKVGAYTMRYESLNIIVETHFGFKLIWNTESYLEVHLPAEFKKKTCGLCGNFNGRPGDDFTGKDGRFYFDSVGFAQTWIHGKKRTCEVGTTQREVQSKCQDNFSQWRRAHQECSILKSPSLADCRKKVNMDPYYKSCITDACNCPRRQNCICDAVTAYVRECERLKLAQHKEALNYACNTQRERIQRRARRRLLLR